MGLMSVFSKEAIEERNKKQAEMDELRAKQAAFKAAKERGEAWVYSKDRSVVEAGVLNEMRNHEKERLSGQISKRSSNSNISRIDSKVDIAMKELLSTAYFYNKLGGTLRCKRDPETKMKEDRYRPTISISEHEAHFCMLVKDGPDGKKVGGPGLSGVLVPYNNGKFDLDCIEMRDSRPVRGYIEDIIIQDLSYSWKDSTKERAKAFNKYGLYASANRTLVFCAFLKINKNSNKITSLKFLGNNKGTVDEIRNIKYFNLTEFIRPAWMDEHPTDISLDALRKLSDNSLVTQEYFTKFGELVSDILRTTLHDTKDETWIAYMGEIEISGTSMITKYDRIATKYIEEIKDTIRTGQNLKETTINSERTLKQVRDTIIKYKQRRAFAEALVVVAIYNETPYLLAHKKDYSSSTDDRFNIVDGFTPYVPIFETQLGCHKDIELALQNHGDIDFNQVVYIVKNIVV